MKIFLGVLIGIGIGAIIWWPLGIMYAVEATEPTKIMKVLSYLKWVTE